MALDINLLRQSFELILERDPNVTTRFYDILFERYPHARPLFGKNSRKAQESMLAQALVAVVEHLEDGAWLTQTLGALGAKHVDYGVTPEMYGWVGDALLTTFAEIAAGDWTAPMAENWTEAYGVIVKLMRQGETATTSASA